jgi:uncharacterized protein YggE
MRVRGFCLGWAATLAIATTAAAQGPSPRTIQVMGSGNVSTMPDLALIGYWATGQGKTPDEASSALASRQQAINDGVRGLLRGAAQISNSNLVVNAVRGAECERNGNYNPQPRLDDGPCAIIGYLATIQGTIRTPEVDKAGTAVALASRLGARDARLEAFQLSDGQSAYGRAMDAAIADAKQQASRIARAAGATLGPILVIRDQNFRAGSDVVATDIGAFPSAPPAPPAPRAPVTIEINPRPIETTAQAYVTFSLNP